jgi:transcriptional regulator with XRE-family HTH domain
MNSPLLPNHLRANRKSSALSQDEVAFLLGNQNGAQVCRYEQFDRVPSLETALAFEAMFKRSVSELFPGLYQKIEQEVATRAKALVEKTGRGKANQRIARKREVLSDLASLRS